MSDSRSVYLDHAASTPMHPDAIEAMTDALATVGNASSLHTAGRAARRNEGRRKLVKTSKKTTFNPDHGMGIAY